MSGAARRLPGRCHEGAWPVEDIETRARAPTACRRCPLSPGTFMPSSRCALRLHRGRPPRRRRRASGRAGRPRGARGRHRRRHPRDRPRLPARGLPARPGGGARAGADVSRARLAVRPAQRRLRDGGRGHPHLRGGGAGRRHLRRRRRRADGAGAGAGHRRPCWARSRWPRLARRPAHGAAARPGRGSAAGGAAAGPVRRLARRRGLDPETAAVADALALVPHLDERAVALVFADIAAALAARLARASPRFGPEPATPFAWTDAGPRATLAGLVDGGEADEFEAVVAGMLAAGVPPRRSRPVLPRAPSGVPRPVAAGGAGARGLARRGARAGRGASGAAGGGARLRGRRGGAAGLPRDRRRARRRAPCRRRGRARVGRALLQFWLPSDDDVDGTGSLLGCGLALAHAAAAAWALELTPVASASLFHARSLAGVYAGAAADASGIRSTIPTPPSPRRSHVARRRRRVASPSAWWRPAWRCRARPDGTGGRAAAAGERRVANGSPRGSCSRRSSPSKPGTPCRFWWVRCDRREQGSRLYDHPRLR